MFWEAEGEGVEGVDAPGDELVVLALVELATSALLEAVSVFGDPHAAVQNNEATIAKREEYLFMASVVPLGRALTAAFLEADVS